MCLWIDLECRVSLKSLLYEKHEYECISWENIVFIRILRWVCDPKKGKEAPYMIPFTNCLSGIPGPSVSCPLHPNLQVVSASPSYLQLQLHPDKSACNCLPHSALCPHLCLCSEDSFPTTPSPHCHLSTLGEMESAQKWYLWEPDSLRPSHPAFLQLCVHMLFPHMLFPLLARSLVGTGAVSYSSQCFQHPAQALSHKGQLVLGDRQTTLTWKLQDRLLDTRGHCGHWNPGLLLALARPNPRLVLGRGKQGIMETLLLGPAAPWLWA